MRSWTAVLGLWLLALASAPGGVAAQLREAVQVALYDEEVSLDLSGDAVVTTRIELTGEAPARWWLPFGHQVAEDLSVRSGNGVEAAAVEVTAVEVAGTPSRASICATSASPVPATDSSATR